MFIHIDFQSESATVYTWYYLILKDWWFLCSDNSLNWCQHFSVASALLGESSKWALVNIIHLNSQLHLPLVNDWKYLGSSCSCFFVGFFNLHVNKIDTSLRLFKLIFFVTMPKKRHFTHQPRWPWGNPFTFQMSGISNIKLYVLYTASSQVQLQWRRKTF